MDVRALRLYQINHFIAGIDTGYDKNECQAIIKKMYKAKKVNWETQLIQFVLFQFIDANGQGQPEFEFLCKDGMEESREQKMKHLTGESN